MSLRCFFAHVLLTTPSKSYLRFWRRYGSAVRCAMISFFDYDVFLSPIFYRRHLSPIFIAVFYRHFLSSLLLLLLSLLFWRRAIMQAITLADIFKEKFSLFTPTQIMRLALDTVCKRKNDLSNRSASGIFEEKHSRIMDTTKKELQICLSMKNSCFIR